MLTILRRTSLAFLAVAALTSCSSQLTARQLSRLARLIVSIQPSGGVSGVALAPQPVVLLEDDAGNTVTDASSVTASLSSGTGTLTGTTTVAAVNGVATFTDLKINGAGMHTLAFSVGDVAPASTGTFAVTQLPAAVQVQVQPAGAVSGVALATQPAVRVVDNAGLPVSSATVAVTAAISSGNGTLSGTRTVSTVNGVATFTNLAITGSGAQVLSFSTTSPVLQATSNSLSVSATPPPPPPTQTPTQVAMSVQPSGAVTGVALTGQPVVQIRDAAGAVVAGSTAAVTATVASGTATLSGTTTVAAVNGVASFTNLILTGSGAVTLQFASPGLTSATSASLTVAAAPPPPPPTGNYLPPDIAHHDFNDGTPGPFTNNFATSITFPTDPTGSGRGRVAQIRYQGSGSQLDLNKTLELTPPASLSLGSTFFFGGDLYFPTGTTNFTNTAAQRKLLYFRTFINGQDFFFVVHLWGNGMQVEWSQNGGDATSGSTPVATLQMGQWYRLETEVKMNSALGANDGVIRVWVNGQVVYQNTAVRFTSTSTPGTPTWEVWWVGQQREGTDVGGTTPEPTIDEVRYWDNIAFSTTRVGP